MVEAGDENTKYFFSMIKRRTMQQSIMQIKDDSNQMQHEKTQIASIFVAYYKELLGTNGEPRTKSSGVIYDQGMKLTEEQQCQLLESVTDAEVKKVIWSMNINKNPGLNGHESGFFRDACSIIGMDICSAVHEFFQIGELLKQINTTMIKLILKTEKPKTTS